MRRMVVTDEGEMRAPSIKGKPALPVRQHIGLPKMSDPQTKGGLTSATAPHKTQMQHFDSKHGFVGGFGDTGLV